MITITPGMPLDPNATFVTITDDHGRTFEQIEGWSATAGLNLQRRFAACAPADAPLSHVEWLLDDRDFRPRPFWWGYNVEGSCVANIEQTATGGYRAVYLTRPVTDRTHGALTLDGAMRIVQANADAHPLPFSVANHTNNQ